MEHFVEHPAVGEPCAVMRYAVYDPLAAFYDCHLGRFPRQLFPALERHLLPSLPAGADVLDLCCGTGQLLQLLAARGYRLRGLDGSREMLRFAAARVPGAELLLEDARTFDQPERFDAVLSTFDSLNHVLSLAELEAVFANVHRSLRPGGRFLFDMNMELGFRLRWWGTLRTEHAGLRWTIRAVFQASKGIGENRVTVSDGEGGSREEFRFVERCYQRLDIAEALRRTGFDRIAVHDAHHDLGIFGEIGRDVFVCRKPARSAGSTRRRGANCLD